MVFLFLTIVVTSFVLLLGFHPAALNALHHQAFPGPGSSHF